MNRIEKKSFTYFSKYIWAFCLLWVITYVSFITKPIALASQNWPFIFIGFIGALIGNISAVGGGLIFIPVTMFIFHIPPLVSLKVAILSQCFGMTSGAFSWRYKYQIPKIYYYLTIPPMLLGSLFSSFIVRPNPQLVKIFFGPMSIIIGILVILSLKKNKHTRTVDQFTLTFKQKISLSLVSLFGGMITGWIAIGEGEIISAFLMLIFQISAPFCITLGVTLLAINSFFLAFIHQFYLNGLPWEIALLSGLGCVFGARFAPLLAEKIKSDTLKIIFAIIAIFDGLLFIMQYLS